MSRLALINREPLTQPVKARRSRRVGYPRATLLWFGIGAIALHLGLLLIIWRHPNVRDPIFSERQRALVTHVGTAGDVDRQLVLILGTSRASNGFDTRGLETILRDETGEAIVAFNFAMPAEGPITQNIYLRRLLRQGIRPGFLIVEVLHFHFFGDERPLESSTLIVERLTQSERERAAACGVQLTAEQKTDWPLWLNPWGELRQSIFAREYERFNPNDVLAHWNRETDAWGWRAVPDERGAPREYRRHLQATREVYELMVRDFRANAPAIRALEDMLALCRERGINVMMVHMPESSDFRSWYSPESARVIGELFPAIARKHSLRYVDSRTWVPDGHFLDGQHLLRSGAEMFSERFGREAALPWIKAVKASAMNPSGTHGDRP